MEILVFDFMQINSFSTLLPLVKVFLEELKMSYGPYFYNYHYLVRITSMGPIICEVEHNPNHIVCTEFLLDIFLKLSQISITIFCIKLIEILRRSQFLNVFIQ